MAEKTTLTANLALVISLKSENTTWNALGSKTPAADFIRSIYGPQRYGPLRFFPTKATNMPTPLYALGFRHKKTPAGRGFDLCVDLLQFKGNRDTEGYPYRTSPLSSRCHLGELFNNPTRLSF